MYTVYIYISIYSLQIVNFMYFVLETMIVSCSNTFFNKQANSERTIQLTKNRFT